MNDSEFSLNIKTKNRGCEKTSMERETWLMEGKRKAQEALMT